MRAAVGVVTVTVEVTPWRLTWRGGRLGDIEHIEYPGRVVECIGVGSWDWATNTQRRPLDAGALQLELGEWASEHGQETLDNVVRYLD